MNRRQAQNSVRGPAITLIAVAAVWIIVLIIGMFFSGFLIKSGVADRMRQPAGMAKETQISIRMGLAAVLVVVNGVILFAGVQMLRMQSYTFARVGVIIAIVPCLSPWYCLGVPIAIWALTTLNNPGVRRAFR